MFSKELLLKISNSLPEWYEDNYDQHRFGPFKQDVKRSAKDAILSRTPLRNAKALAERMQWFNKYLNGLETTYALLTDKKSKDLLVDLMAYRILGHRHVKLPTNTLDYWDVLARLEKAANKSREELDTGFLDFKLSKMNLAELGYDLDMYVRPPAVMAQVFLGQYKYSNGQIVIQAETGDVVLDCGGCWGETAMFFAENVGDSGKVLCFEFVPSNLKILNKNVSMNARIAERVTVVENPLWSADGGELYYQDRGPASRCDSEKFEGATGSVSLKTIDQIFEEQGLEKVSFIKMDIEGAELNALKGGEHTIRKFKPKLAISLYHSLEDFCVIPAYINSLELGYEFYLGHATIHAEETVLFAVVK